VDVDLSDGATPSAAAALAEEAHRLVGADPQRARTLAREALDQALEAGDAETASVAQRALGMISIELDDAPTAVEHLHAAIASARRGASSASARARDLARIAAVVSNRAPPVRRLDEGVRRHGRGGRVRRRLLRRKPPG
jgi:hypothetical protein